MALFASLLASLVHKISKWPFVYKFSATAVPTSALLFYRYGPRFMFAIFVYVTACAFGVAIGLQIVLLYGKKYRPKITRKETGIILKALLNQHGGSSTSLPKRQAVISRNVDTALNEVFELIIRDYILYWFEDVVHKPQKLSSIIREDLWTVTDNLHERMSKIDQLKFMTNDVTNILCRHYQKIRLASNGSEGKEIRPTFQVKPYLQNSQLELDFLRKLSETALVLLFPRSYSSSRPARHLLREIIACVVFKPTIDMICDPDYINQKLLGYIQRHQELLQLHRKKYTYAPTYEEFIKLINETNDIEHMKHMRFNIVTEIMQANAINNLKKAKGLDLDKESSPQGSGKGDLLQARNLGRYIKQLNYARTLCEKRIKYLGGTDFSMDWQQMDDPADERTNTRDAKVMGFNEIMESDFARQCFLKFLEKEDGDGDALLRYWLAIDEMSREEKPYQHQLANEIFQTYVASSSTPIKLDRSIIKNMEAFMIANKGIQGFIQAQVEICNLLEEKYYPSFLCSDIYLRMKNDAARLHKSDIVSDLPDSFDDCDHSSLDSASSEVGGNFQLADQSAFAKKKLNSLREKIVNKQQALVGLKNSCKAEQKVTTMLEKEIEEMMLEFEQLEHHLTRTEIWSENLGKWKVLVHSTEYEEDKDRIILSFNLIVQPNDEDCDDSNNGGWLVRRRISEFHELNRKLSQMRNSLKTIELPRDARLRGKIQDPNQLEKTLCLLQQFLDVVMDDEKLNKSEVLYAFLSPSPELLKQNLSPKRSNKFSAFTTFFKSSTGSQGSNQTDISDEDEFIFFDDVDTALTKDDRLADPLYSLIGEIFDMRGVFKLLRRTVISFVQITFGRTITRQLRETVSYIFSESMLLTYVNTFRDSIWPDGQLANPLPFRTDEEKLLTRRQAKEQILNNIPDVLGSMVGQQNSRRGAEKLFESLQDATLNKQLFYTLLEAFVAEVFPELKGGSGSFESTG